MSSTILQEILQEIFTEFQNNMKFREELKENRLLAIKNFLAIKKLEFTELSPEDLSKIESLLKKIESKSEELDKRINK